MGGGAAQPTPPQAPNATDTAREAIAAELELGPQLARQKMDLQGELTPIQAQQFIDLQQNYGGALGKATQDFRQSMDPEMFAMDRELLADTQQRMQTGMTPEEEQSFERRYSAQEASAGRLGAPVGSVNIARQMTATNMQAKNDAKNIALSMSGRLPVQAQTGLGLAQPNTSSEFLSPFMNMASNSYSTGANIFGTQQNALNQANAQRTQMISSGIGAIGSMGGSYLGRG